MQNHHLKKSQGLQLTFMLQTVRRYMDNNMIKNLPEIWSRAWQVKQRKQKNRDSYLKINEELLGTTLFEELMNLSLKLRTHPAKSRAIALLQNELE